MGFLFSVILLGIILGIIKSLPEIVKLCSRYKGNKGASQAYLPYKKKRYLLTEAEHRFFIALQEAIEDQYYIFPQIHLANLLYVPKGTYHWKTYFNRIIQKSVDFVICEKEYLSPVLAIELNDSSHNLPDRIERDKFVEASLEKSGLPILIVLNQGSYDEDSIGRLREEIYKRI